MPYGYNGKILHVNLTDLNFEIEIPEDIFYRKYIGGSGLAAYYLLKNIGPSVDPLGPENILIFTGSVVTGAPFSGFSRYTVAAKSPLTGGFGESEAGGYFGPELKFSGFDAVVIKGKAPKPVYLWINNGRVELKDADAVWGLGNSETLDKIREEVGDEKARIASIGPAGERMVLFANVMNELAHANGRCGLGAVMGSKHLKAIACRGDAKHLEFSDAETVKKLVSWHNQRIKEHLPNQNLRKYGTPMFVVGLNKAGILPTRNWRESVFEGAEKIGVPSYEKTLKRHATCYRCAVGCKRVVETAEPYFVNPRYGGPEYETLAAFGSLCGIDDLGAVAKANELCNHNGLDTIGTGSVVAFAMECFENSVLTAADADGRKILFGDADGMLWLVDKIANREGLGDLLAQGIKRAAQKMGDKAQAYAFTIKGQEIPLHDPRGKTGIGLGFALSPTGADHIETPHDTIFVGDAVKLLAPLGILDPVEPLALDEAKVRFFKQGQLSWGLNNVLGICNFVDAPLFALSYEKLVEAVKAITGWETSLWELLRATERSEVMARIFNNRQGFGSEDDRLFRRLHEPIPAGPLKGQQIDPDQMKKAIQLYYEMMGWDEQGRPLPAKLHDLSLGWLMETESDA